MECEDSRWSSYAANLQQQLDVALSKLNARNLQRSQDNSENENNDSGDKSEVKVVTAK